MTFSIYIFEEVRENKKQKMKEIRKWKNTYMEEIIWAEKKEREWTKETHGGRYICLHSQTENFWHSVTA
jgi:hypothetical protein